MKRVVLVGGGTAGHVEPALAVGRWLLKQRPELDLSFIGTKSGIEVELLVDTGIKFNSIIKVPFPRKISISTLIWPLKFFVGIVQSARAIRGSDLVVGFGGYVSAPAYVAAWILRTPLIIHEANAKPGLANILGTYLTKNSFVAYPRTRELNRRFSKSTYSGMPIKSKIDNFDFAQSSQMRQDFLNSLNLPLDKRTLLVFGGSLGAQRLNEAITQSKTAILATNWNLIHVVGSSNTLPENSGNYRALRYINEMDLAYAACDFVICRAGAVTCAELAAVGAPALLVPLPIGNGEQIENARDLVATGQAQMIANQDFTSEWVTQNLIEILKKAPARFKGISKRADEVIGMRALELIRLS